ALQDLIHVHCNPLAMVCVAWPLCQEKAGLHALAKRNQCRHSRLYSCARLGNVKGLDRIKSASARSRVIALNAPSWPSLRFSSLDLPPALLACLLKMQGWDLLDDLTDYGRSVMFEIHGCFSRMSS